MFCGHYCYSTRSVGIAKLYINLWFSYCCFRISVPALNNLSPCAAATFPAFLRPIPSFWIGYVSSIRYLWIRTPSHVCCKLAPRLVLDFQLFAYIIRTPSLVWFIPMALVKGYVLLGMCMTPVLAAVGAWIRFVVLLTTTWLGAVFVAPPLLLLVLLPLAVTAMAASWFNRGFTVWHGSII